VKEEKKVFDFFVFIILITAFTYLTINSFKLRIKNLSLTHEILQAYIDKNIISEQLRLSLENKVDEESKSRDDFLVFISQSRDWAFDYIETTQAQINSFINNVGPTIDYLEQYAPPILLEEQRLSIIEGYKTIKSILPEDYGKLDT
jgi:hypothetical protein